jgi:putative transposase
MANTYTQAYVHLVFSVKNRDALIGPGWRIELEKYITGIIQNHHHKPLAIYAMPDHIHILIGYNVNQLIPELVEKIKTSSNAWIKKEKKSKFRFEWQKGYGAFTHSHSRIDRVIKYIQNQQFHHRKEPFREEYLSILRENNVNYNDEYLFSFFDF